MGRLSLIGRIVIPKIAWMKGYVRVHGKLWQAEVMRSYPAIDRGQPVRIEEIRDLTLLVQIDNGESID